MFIVVSYDIPDDDRRLKVSRVLLNRGERVQYSVFECILSHQDLEELEAELEKIINSKEDDIRYYCVCKDCLKQTKVVSGRPLTTDTGYYIV